MIKTVFRWWKDRPQRLRNTPLKLLRWDLILSVLFLAVCILLSIWGIKDKGHLTGAFCFGLPLGANLIFLSNRWEVRTIIRLPGWFDMAAIVVLLLIVGSLTAYAFDNPWYMGGLLISVVVNAIQIYKMTCMIAARIQ